MKKDRQLAVFLCVAAVLLSGGLSGCVNSQGHPLLATLGAFLPGGGKGAADAAAKIKYASIKFSAGRRTGLLILSEQATGVTFWQSGQAETVVLRNGYLQSTSGLKSNLEMTRLTAAGNSSGTATPWSGDLSSSIKYKVLRTWRGDDDRLRSGSAAAELNCETDTKPIKLPLATLPLKKCVEALSWESGAQTKSVYWIDPTDHRIWAGDVVARPSGPEYVWQVARPWW